MNAADLFVKCLEEEKVEYIFGLPGEENLQLLESIRKSKIKLIVNRHEQASAFMAATYGRLTGKPGICLSTLGPGATNLVTGIAHAQLGGMPLIAITGQKGIRENKQANFQVIDIVHLMKPITKRSTRINTYLDIPKEIRTAFKTATTERQGACHIELPEDIASEKWLEHISPHPALKIRRPVADLKAIMNTAEMIKAAKNPLIILSSRAQRKLVKESLLQFCEQTNIYVVHTQLGKGVFSDTHKNSLHAFGIHKKDYVHCIVDRADLIITIGYSPSEYPPSVWNPKLEKKIIHLDFTPAENDIYYAPVQELIGDIAHSLTQLRQHLQEYRYDGKYEEKIKKELEQKLFVQGIHEAHYPLRPRRIVADCRKSLRKDDIICLDNGVYKLWFSRHYPTYEIGTFLLDNALATMGAGLPSAMAAKMINPHKNVLAVVGDGGFMMNSQELETAVRLGLNIVVLILNDNAYGFIKWKQQAMGLADFGLDYHNPDFVKYAQSYGAKGIRINKAEDLLPTLEKAFKEKGPVLIECPIDYSENIKTWSQELNSIVCPM